MAVVLKTTKVQAFGGSNPSPSATSEYKSASKTSMLSASWSIPLVADGNRDATTYIYASTGFAKIGGGR